MRDAGDVCGGGGGGTTYIRQDDRHVALVLLRYMCWGKRGEGGERGKEPPTNLRAPLAASYCGLSWWPRGHRTLPPVPLVHNTPPESQTGAYLVRGSYNCAIEALGYNRLYCYLCCITIDKGNGNQMGGRRSGTSQQDPCGSANDRNRKCTQAEHCGADPRIGTELNPVPNPHGSYAPMYLEQAVSETKREEMGYKKGKGGAGTQPQTAPPPGDLWSLGSLCWRLQCAVGHPHTGACERKGQAGA